jgi:hypothetical protein
MNNENSSKAMDFKNKWADAVKEITQVLKEESEKEKAKMS